ncbi:MAG: hemolysin III family protein [Candidatus Pacebacteria bacterium]|nr:hemolysin III family protein [Candidatus Paceibacterota bacterium]
MKGEMFNAVSHLLGAVASVLVTVVLIVLASLYGSAWHIVSFSLFGTSLILLYLSSTLYHASRKESWRNRMQRFDHAMILVLIAGTYTPFMLTVLRGGWGWSIFGFVWGIAILGIIWKFVATSITGTASTILYLLMGWVVVVAAYPLVHVTTKNTLIFLILGGVAYTLGAICYSYEDHPRFQTWKITPHNIFHLFVLLGSASHVVAIIYLLPSHL